MRTNGRVPVIWILLIIHSTDEKESPQEAKPAWKNSRLAFIDAVHQW